MGSSHTRPKLTQVVPSRSPLEREISQAAHQIGQPISNWTIKSLQSSQEVQEGSFGQRRNNQLPPLRQEVPLTFSPLAAGCMSHSLSSNLGPSIIQSFPPLRPQVLEPLARTTILREGGSKVQQNEQRGSWASSGECREDERLERKTERHSRQPEPRCLKYLEAQAVLDRQAHIQRGSHRRRIREMLEQREQRRQGRTVYTGIVDREDYGNKVQRVHLVKRPTERDIFWDVSSEGELDFGDLSRGSPGPPECEEMTTSAELHCSLSNKEVALEELEQGHPRLSQEKTRSKKKKARMMQNDCHSKTRTQKEEKTLPWMLGWKSLEYRERNPSVESDDRGETAESNMRSGSAWPIQQEERHYSDNNSSTKSEEGWEFGPQAAERQQHRGRLIRTRLELIPSLQNQQDLESEM